MQPATMLSLASLLMLSSLTAFATDAGSATVDGWHHDDSAMKRLPDQRTMFDGVKLTEQQRQQMRDLMYQGRQDVTPFNTQDVETMHNLLTANVFDEDAVRKQITRMMEVQIERQVQMTRVRNQMYNLLTPEQKNILEQKHQQRMQQMERQISLLNQMPSP
ncbi:protein CpxP|uniref:Protein CpxP n=1 Tax=Brenneria salicis ATCC 15712 = DSM 30166 TaxID=714314 RepID=A0A366I8Z3_9GAMM|nr:cell-envelope stress modulator CpxP [Brenneria salicis]NMN93221.1 protein CpxP [Brenneria salicis ATCC 15712 = DSM 30166]RBP64082.1 protein CpxP [Brenneria salicis ATCC 15712 = DSM 30166]RLM31112.1 stress adaptor protein CpxP [Brenneria salicis ATCC 15712 = DSM 30166]